LPLYILDNFLPPSLCPIPNEEHFLQYLDLHCEVGHLLLHNEHIFHLMRFFPDMIDPSLFPIFKDEHFLQYPLLALADLDFSLHPLHIFHLI